MGLFGKEEDMTEAKTTAESQTEDVGINKDGRREGVSLNWQASRALGVTADFNAGVARAFASAFDGFRDELRADGELRLDLINVFLEGTSEGFARFFEELGRTGRGVRNEIVHNRVEKPTVKVDYDLLADKVAERLSRRREDAPKSSRS
jgi:hypothetical protein